MALDGEKVNYHDPETGNSVKGLRRRACGQYTVAKGAIKKTLPDYDISFDFTLAGERFRTRFGRESEFGGSWSADGTWQPHAYRLASLKLAEYRHNAQNGAGPVSKRQALADEATERKARQLELERRRTFDSLVTEYLAAVSVRPATLRQYRDSLSKATAYKPARGEAPLGEQILEDIPRARLAALIEETAKQSAATAIVLRSALSAFYTWAAESPRELVTGNPIATIKRPAKLAPRDRTLTDAELVTVWEATNDAKILPRVLRFLILTGCRITEALEIERSEIDGEWWTIPAIRAKGKRPHRVYLTESARGLLGPGPRPFDNPETEKPFSTAAVNHHLARVNWFGLPRFSPHDCRRTIGSGLAALGYSIDVCAAVLAHKLQGVTAAHYLRHSFDPQKRAALLAWERHVLKITTGSNDAKIIKLDAWR